MSFMELTVTPIYSVPMILGALISFLPAQLLRIKFNVSATKRASPHKKIFYTPALPILRENKAKLLTKNNFPLEKSILSLE